MWSRAQAFELGHIVVLNGAHSTNLTENGAVDVDLFPFAHAQHHPRTAKERGHRRAVIGLCAANQGIRVEARVAAQFLVLLRQFDHRCLGLGDFTPRSQDIQLSQLRPAVKNLVNDDADDQTGRHQGPHCPQCSTQSCSWKEDYISLLCKPNNTPNLGLYKALSLLLLLRKYFVVVHLWP